MQYLVLSKVYQGCFNRQHASTFLWPDVSKSSERWFVLDGSVQVPDPHDHEKEANRKLWVCTGLLL